MRTNYVRKTRDLPTDLKAHEPDWREVIHALLRVGFKKARLAEGMDTTRERFYAIFDGRMAPTYGQGCYLLELKRREGL